MDEKIEIEALIHKYLTGEATEEERQYVDAWLQESKENWERFEEIRQIWDFADSGPFEISDNDLRYELLKFQQTIARKKEGRYQRIIDRFKKTGRYKNAAIIILAVAASALMYAMLAYSDLSTKAVTVQNSHVVMPDSSQISTNKESTISFRQTLWKREVNLQGEAFFEVKRNESKPFWVYSGDTRIKVLGTSFLVRAYPGEPVQVSVVSGNVAVWRSQQEIRLATGEQVIITGEGKMRKLSGIHPNLLAWKTKTLVFNAASILDVLDALEDLYGVTFEIRDAGIRNRHYTGTIAHLSLEEAVDLITSTLRLSARYESSTLIELSDNNHIDQTP